MMKQLNPKDIQESPEILAGFIVIVSLACYSMFTVCSILNKLRNNLKREDPKMKE